MPKIPVDAPKSRVINAPESLGFQIVRQREHIAMLRSNPDGTSTPLTLPNNQRINAPHDLYAIRNLACRIS